MITIPVLTTSNEVVTAMHKAHAQHLNFFIPAFFSQEHEFLDFSKSRIPEIKIIDFCHIGGERSQLLDQLTEDSLLAVGGIIAIIPDGVASDRSFLPNPLIILTVTHREFVRNIGRILKICEQNFHFVISHLMHQQLGICVTGSFVCDNDSHDIMYYTNLLTILVYNVGCIDYENRYLVLTALMEMLLNALEHGNCGIDFCDKKNWLEKGLNILRLIGMRNSDNRVSQRKIFITYELGETEVKFIIRDEGNGFDWQAVLEKDVVPGLHGLGIKMTQGLVKTLSYNEKGNEVTFSIENTMSRPHKINPDYVIVPVSENEVLTQEAQSEYMYLVLQGLYLVAHEDRDYVISAKHILLSDVFLCPVASASSFSIRALKDGQLIQIKKTDFGQLLQKFPQYEIVLTRLFKYVY